MDLNIENVNLNPTLPSNILPQALPEIKPTSSRLPMILVLTLVVLLLGGLAGSFAVAYGKINLGNPSIENSLTRLILSLPFTPKTPKYLLESSTLAHKKVTKHALEISIAAIPAVSEPI